MIWHISNAIKIENNVEPRFKKQKLLRNKLSRAELRKAKIYEFKSQNPEMGCRYKTEVLTTELQEICKYNNWSEQPRTYVTCGPSIQF